MRSPAWSIVVAIWLAAGGAAAQSTAEDCHARAAEGAFALCGNAVAEAPDDIALRRSWALSLSKAGRYDESIRQYAEIVRRTPADGRAHYEHAYMLALVRRYAEAAAPIEEAMRLRPDHVPTMRAAAIIFFMVGRPADVFRAAQAGARIGDPIAMYDTAECYAKGRGVAQDEAQALAWMRRAAEAGHVAAMDKLTEIYLEGGWGAAPDPSQAEEWATKARRARQGGKL